MSEWAAMSTWDVTTPAADPLWTLALDADFANMAAADWKTTPPTTLDGVAVTTLGSSGWTSLAVVPGVGLRGIVTATTGVFNLRATLAALGSALDVDLQPDDIFIAEVQIAASQQPWSSAWTQVYITISNPASGGAVASSHMGKSDGAGSTNMIRHNIDGVRDTQVSLTNNNMRSAAIWLMGPTVTRHYNSTGALPTDLPLSAVEAITSNPSGVTFNHLTTGLLCEGRFSLAPTISGNLLGFSIVHDQSGTDTMIIERFRVWHRAVP